MKFRPHGFFPCILAIALTVLAMNAASYAQSVSISHSGATTQEAPATFTVTATPTGGSFTKVLFYRNDVPFHTDTTSTYTLPQTSVGQETYTYRARAYTSATAYVESSSITVIVTTKQARIHRMGDPVPTPTPGGPSPTPTPTPMGPNRGFDHTASVRHALKYLEDNGGGTLFFPCSQGSWYGSPDIAMYNISETVVIPSNVTLQGESAESPEGRCRLNWRDPDFNPPWDDDPEKRCYDNEDDDPNTNDLLNKPMFQINGGTSGVRFRDLFIYSRSSGPDCHTRQDYDRIAEEGTVAIALYGFGGDINDVILENVSIASFTYGVKATTCAPNEFGGGCIDSGYGISDVRLRAFRPGGNFRALSIDSPEAHDWDVQNMNVAIGPDQGGVEIIEAGKPSGYSGENGRLKFLQVNCAGVARLSAFCVEVKKHGGLYFRQLFHEGTTRAMHVRDIDPDSNTEPIVLENSAATGMFYDDSMKLYLVGSGVMSSPEYAPPDQDNGRLEFFGDGLNSTIVDCGDYHVDRTDTQVSDSDPDTYPTWDDWRMMGTHSERNRRSFYAPLTNYTIEVPRKVCPEGVGGSVPNTSSIGGDHFDTGVLPVEPGVYEASQIYDSGDCGGDSDCANEFQSLLDSIYDGRTLVIYGNVPVKSTVVVKKGRQVVGIPGLQSAPPQISFTPNGGVTHLLEIPTTPGGRTSGVTIRNLKLLKTSSAAGTGLKLLGANHASSIGEATDVHLSGLTIENFETGFYAGIQPSMANPMLDGLSFKNLSFVNNTSEAVRIDSQNASNWNLMNLSIQSNSSSAEGWDQKYGGGYVFQNVNCTGTSSYDMKDCLAFEMGSGIYITGLKKTSYVTNVVTINVPPYTYGSSPYVAWPISQLFIRNSDLRTESTSPARYSVNMDGKSFIVSMNNKYDYFASVGSSSDEDESSVTSCGDSYDSGVGLYPGLASAGYFNNYVGLNTPGLIVCAATNPYKWDSPVRWGVETDTRMVANIYDDNQEDFISFRPGSSAVWLIRQQQGSGVIEKQWGTTGDIPVVGKFLDSTARSQIAVFRPSTGAWWTWDFVSNSSGVPVFGTSGDIPLVGNFFDESNNRDEIAIFRPSSNTFWILNPRTSYSENHWRGSTSYGTDFHVGDFLNLGYDQVAQWQGNGTWEVFNLETGAASTLYFGTTGDVPVVGNYFSGGCTQLGVWRPSVQKFLVEDPVASCGGGTKRDGEVEWGLAYASGTSDDDLPITVKNSSGIDQPTAIRRINADPTFPYFITENFWWVHAPIVP